MKKFLSSISRSDYSKLCLLVALYAILCGLGIGVIFLRMGIDAILFNFFPHIAQRTRVAKAVFWILLAAIFALPTGILIRKLRVWLISLPIQALLNAAIIRLIYGDSISSIVKIFTFILIAQTIGVALGLLIRYLIRKIRSRKQSAQAA